MAGPRGTVDLRPLVSQVQGDMASLMTLNLAGSVAAAVATAPNAIQSRMLKSLAEVFADPTRDAARRAETHRRIGERAHRSLMASYGARVSKGRSATYREGGSRSGPPWSGRLAGGVLKRALQNDAAHILATPDGLGFINTKVLDNEAAHWRRIAFGVGGSGVQVSSGVEWSGRVVGNLSLDVPASEAYTMPGGAWLPGGRFYPTSELPHDYAGPRVGPRHVARAIGHDFLTRPIQVIAEALPEEYQAYYRQIWAEFKQGLGPLVQVRNVVPPRPAFQRAYRI